MSVEEKVSELDTKIGSLEKAIHGYKVGFIVLGIATTLFLYYNWTTIPKKIEDSFTDKIGQDTISTIDKALTKSKIFLQDSDIGNWRTGEINPLTSVARSICYSALSGPNDHALIMIPLENNTIDLDAKCHSTINDSWHAGGVAKGSYTNQDCSDIENKSYGGGYTSFVTEKSFEDNRSNYRSCNSKNAFICCSPQFSN